MRAGVEEDFQPRRSIFFIRIKKLLPRVLVAIGVRIEHHRARCIVMTSHDVIDPFR